MRAPSPVVVDLGPEPFWRLAVAGLWAVSVTSLLTWLFLRGGWGGQDAASAGLAGALREGSAARLFWLIPGAAVAWVTGWCSWRWGRQDPLRLAWTGQGWQWSSLGDATDVRACAQITDLHDCAPRVMLDLGGWMLLRLGAAGRSGHRDWVAVSAKQAGAQWHGLRVALYAAPGAAPEHPEGGV